MVTVPVYEARKTLVPLNEVFKFVKYT